MVVPLRGGRILPLIFNAQGRKVLNDKEGMNWGASEGLVHVTIRVIDGPGAADRILIQRQNIKGNPLADWSGDLDTLAKPGEGHPAFPQQPVASVFVMQDKYAVQTWKLRVFEGEAKVLRGGKDEPPVVTARSESPSLNPLWQGWTGPQGAPLTEKWNNGAEISTRERTTLWSPGKHRNFELEMEWRVGTRGNAGIFYHVQGDNELEAFEMQLCDPANSGGTRSGGLFGVQNETRDAAKPVGQWNLAKLVVNGPIREHWINGELVCSYDVSDAQFRAKVSNSKLPVKPSLDASEGRVVLQANAGEVMYRVVRIRPLEASARSSTAPAMTPPSAATTAASVPPPSPPPAVANDPVSAKLADLGAKFQAAFERHAGADYKAQVAKLNTGYVTALDRALATASKAGNLDEAVVLREEKERITSGKGLPPEDLDTLPESLKKLRGTWRGAEAGYAKQRNTLAAPLFDAYDKALDAFQTELTKQNKIDDALRVKTARDELVQRRSSIAPAAVETPAPAKTTMPTPAASTTVEASSSWRKAAEWILGVGGEIRIRRSDGGQLTLKDAKDLPGGRFDITNIILNLPNGKGAQITDDDLTRFNGLRGIEVVNLTHLPGVTGAGLAALAASADSMREVTLYDVGLQPQHVGFIAQFKNLKNLTFDGLKDATSESLTRLGELRELRNLRMLQTPAFDDRALLALAGLTKLEGFDTTNATFTDEGMAAFKGMKDLKNLNLGGIKGVRGPGLVHIAGASGLTKINLGSTQVTDESLAAISGLKNLTDVNLSNTSVTSACLKHLGPLKQLRSLNLSAEKFTGVGLDALTGCNELRQLVCGGGGGNPPCNMTDDGLRDLAKAALPKLEQLNIKGQTITDAGYAHLAAYKLKQLDVEKQPGVEGMRAIATISTLETLNFGSGPAGDAEVVPLTALKGLKHLSFYISEVTDAALPGLLAMPNLKSFYFYQSKITPAAIEAAKKTRPDLKIGR